MMIPGLNPRKKPILPISPRYWKWLFHYLFWFIHYCQTHFWVNEVPPSFPGKDPWRWTTTPWVSSFWSTSLPCVAVKSRLRCKLLSSSRSYDSCWWIENPPKDKVGVVKKWGIMMDIPILLLFSSIKFIGFYWHFMAISVGIPDATDIPWYIFVECPRWKA